MPTGRDRRQDTTDVVELHPVHTEPGSSSEDPVRSPLVGRDAELDAIREVIEQAVDFQAPHLITVIGNQGTGKSRLVADLVAEIGPPMRVFAGQAEPGGGRYHVIASLLRDRFGIGESSGQDGHAGAGAKPTADEVSARLEAEVRQVFGDERIDEVLHFLGGFLGVPLPKSSFLRILSENRRHYDEIERTVLRRFIEKDAHQSPLLLWFDNLQWADDDSLLVLRELGAGLGGSPIVMIACARPEMLVRSADWGSGSTDHLRIDLRNLEHEDAESMLRNLLARCSGAGQELVDDAVEMTGGNPHFLEQLVRLFLANGTIDTSGPRWRIDPVRAAETELPISIEEAIEARIAALAAPERELLERAAVFGNVFWLGALVALGRIDISEVGERHEDDPPPPPPPAELDYRWTAEDEPVRRRIRAIVDELVEQDYLLELDPEDSSIPGDLEIVFKHNLERELITKSTEARRLTRYHRLAAQWLESNLAGRSEEQLEFLAQLYERGGDRRRAAHCYLAGGDTARARYANEEAVRLYQHGLEMIEDDDALARMDALHNLGDVLALTGRADEATHCFSQMLRLAWLFDNQAKGGAAHSRLGRIYRRRGEYDRAMEHLREANSLFERAGDRRGIAGTLDDIGKVHWLRGAYGQALEFHRQALSIRRALGDRRSIALSLANIGRVHNDSGAFKAAIQQFREALDLRRDIGDLSGVVSSLCDLGGVQSVDGNHEMALELFNEAYQIAVDIGDKIAQTDVLSRMGACKAAMGHGREAVQHLQAAIQQATTLGDRVSLAECCRRLAEVYLGLNEVEQAHDNASRALAISESVGSRVHVGISHRVLAEAITAAGLEGERAAAAGEHYRRAVDILAGMKNELELAHCYRSYAVFRDQTGHPEDAAKLRRRAEEIFGRLRGAATARMGTGSSFT